jgi:ABC-type transporter Mla subunit MlaD
MNQGHFKLGLFVITAVGLLAGVLLLLGVLQRFQPTTTVETYFTEPVNGLSKGTEVRYRGLKVGVVGAISLAQTRYGTTNITETTDLLGRLILVDMEINNATLARYGADMDGFRDLLNRTVQAGMRARLESSGLGGPLFIELDYLEPQFRNDLVINWKPRNLYVPSARSSVRTIIDNLQALLADLDRIKLVDKLAMMIGDLQTSIHLLKDSNLIPTAQQTLKEVGTASTAFERLLADQRINEVLDSARSAIADVRAAIRDGRTGIPPLVDKLSGMSESLTQAAEDLDRLAQTVDRTRLIPQLDVLVKDLGPSGKALGRLAGRLDRLISDNSAQLLDTIQALRSAAFELRALLEDVKANPSRVIFSGPPAKGTPGNKP